MRDRLFGGQALWGAGSLGGRLHFKRRLSSEWGQAGISAPNGDRLGSVLWIVAKEGLPLWLGTWTVSKVVVVGMAVGGRF